MIRFVTLPDPSYGLPYATTDFSSVLQDEHVKAYSSLLDGINYGSTSSAEPLNSGIILSGCDILSATTSLFDMGFTNSVVYINGEFYQNDPTYTGTVTINNGTFYIVPDTVTYSYRTLLDLTTSATASVTRYFKYQTSAPTEPYIKFSNQGTSRYYKRVLKYFTSRTGDVYISKSKEKFDVNGVGFNDMEGFVMLDDITGITGTPDFRGKFLRGWESGLVLGSTGGENTHRVTLSELGSHTHQTLDALWDKDWYSPVTFLSNTGAATLFFSSAATNTDVDITNNTYPSTAHPYYSPQQMSAQRSWRAMDFVDYNQDPNNFWNPTTRKFTYSATQSVKMRFKMNLRLEIWGNTGLNPWVDSILPGFIDDIYLWVVRNKNPFSGTVVVSSVDFNKDMSITKVTECFQIPFKKMDGYPTGYSPNLHPFPQQPITKPGLALRQFIFSPIGATAPNDLPKWVWGYSNGGQSVEASGELYSEYFYPVIGEEFLFFLTRFPSNNPPSVPIYTPQTYILSGSSFNAEVDPIEGGPKDATLEHFHYFNTGRSTTLQNPTEDPITSGPSVQMDPDSPYTTPPVGEPLANANQTTGSIFSQVDFSVQNNSNYQWTGGVNDLANSELQNHVHSIDTYDFGDGDPNNPGQPHENRPPYYVVNYYTKKPNT